MSNDLRFRAVTARLMALKGVDILKMDYSQLIDWLRNEFSETHYYAFKGAFDYASHSDIIEERIEEIKEIVRKI